MFPFPHDRFRQPAATRATRFSSEPPRDVGPRREHAPVRRAGTPDQPQGRADALPPSSFGPSGFAAPGATFVPASAPLPPLAVETSLLEARLAYAKLLSGAFGAASPHEIHDVFAERLAVVRSRASRKTQRALAPVVSLVRSDFDLSGLIDASHDESKALRGRGVPSADIARTAHQRSDDAARRILARLYGEQGRFAVCTGTEHHTIVLEGRAPRGEAPSFRIYNTGFGLEKHPPVDRWRCEMHAMSTAPGGTRGRKSFTSFVVNDVAPRRLNPAALSELLFEGIFQPDVYASPGEAAEDYEEASIHHVYDVAASLGVPEWRPQNRAIQSDQKELTCLLDPFLALAREHLEPDEYAETKSLLLSDASGLLQNHRFDRIPDRDRARAACVRLIDKKTRLDVKRSFASDIRADLARQPGDFPYAGTMTPSEARRLLLAPGAPTRSFCFYETDDRGALFTLAERRGEDIKHYPLAADVDDRGATGSIALIERTVGEPRHQALRLDAHNLREVAALEVADEGLTPWRQPRDIPSPSSHDDAALLMSFAQSAAAAASPSAAPTAVTTARTRNDEESIEALAARMLGAPVRPGQVAVSRAEARDIATTIVTALEPAQRHAAQTRGVAVIDERDGRRLPYAVEFHPDGSVTWSRR